MKCEICNKKLAECPVGGDDSKYCQGHTSSEREAYEKEKNK